MSPEISARAKGRARRRRLDSLAGFQLEFEMKNARRGFQGSRDAAVAYCSKAAAPFCVLWRVEFGAGNRDEMPQMPIKGFATGDQHLSIRQHGHAFSEA